MTVEHDGRIGTKATPEGRAFYPLGSWGGGYILNARAERRLLRWHRWRIWVQTGLIMVIVPDFMPGSLGLKLLVCSCATAALIAAIHYWCVHGCRRTTVRLSSEENLRMEAKGLKPDLVGAQVILCIALSCFLVWQTAYAAPGRRWGPVVGTLVLAAWAWSIVHFIRVALAKRRLDRCTPTGPGQGDHF